MKLSIIITSLNDHEETQYTIASIRATAGSKPEIIVVDDMSQVQLVLEDKDCLLIRNEHRAGVAASRHIGALHATRPYLLFIDAHMRFEKGWYEEAAKRIDGRETTLHCAMSLGLTPTNMDIRRAEAHYTGATINFFGPDRNKPGAVQIMESIWLDDVKGRDDYWIPSIMGACYFVPREFFFHVGGLKLLRGWGGDEPFLSLKWWLAGGDVRMMKSVRIGHQYRQATTYRTEDWKPIYNKMAIIHTCLPEPYRSRLLKKFGNEKQVIEAKNAIAADWNLIATEQKELDGIFTRNFEWFLQYTGIPFPD